MDLGGWIMTIGVCVGALLPVFTLTKPSARRTAAILAVLGIALMLYLWWLTGERSSGFFPDFGTLFLALGATLFLLVLMLVGVAGALARTRFLSFAKLRPALSAAARYAIAALITAAWAFGLFGAAMGTSRLQESRYEARLDARYSRGASAVTAAHNSTPPQTKAEMLSKAEEALNASDEVAMRSRVLALLHPAVLENDKYTVEEDWAYELDDFVGSEVRGAIEDILAQAVPQGSIGASSVTRPERAISVRMGGEVHTWDVGPYFEDLLYFYDRKRLDTVTGENPLFPNGRLFELSVTVDDEDVERQIGKLWAVDDEGKWWLVGIDAVYADQDESEAPVDESAPSSTPTSTSPAKGGAGMSGAMGSQSPSGAGASGGLGESPEY